MASSSELTAFQIGSFAGRPLDRAAANASRNFKSHSTIEHGKKGGNEFEEPKKRQCQGKYMSIGNLSIQKLAKSIACSLRLHAHTVHESTGTISRSHHMALCGFYSRCNGTWVGSCNTPHDTARATENRCCSEAHDEFGFSFQKVLGLFRSGNHLYSTNKSGRVSNTHRLKPDSCGVYTSQS